MAEREERHPVVTGLLALVAVALVVGLLLGGVALVGARVLGVGGSTASGGAAAEASDSLYLPSPSPTTASPTASPSATAASSATGSPAGSPSASPSRATPITLIAGQRRVPVYQPIDLSGSYPDGEGAVLEVQRLEGDDWVDFYSVSTVVQGGRFSTVVQTSRAGVNAFRVVDTDSRTASNPVRVRVG